MGLRCGMRTTKCQLLVTSLCVMLLGLSIATLSTVTHYGLRFTLISNISLDSNAYRAIHHAAFYFGISLSMTLILAALLSSAATVRESQCLTAMVRTHTCRDWLGGAFCHRGWPPQRAVQRVGSAAVLPPLWLGECTPGEGGPVVPLCAARGQF
uniref:Tetraspanin 32 n=1 Tax=Cyanistes caeruleus TaxID=156563 RepID=A0A8C0UF68_CYACU